MFYYIRTSAALQQRCTALIWYAAALQTLTICLLPAGGGGKRPPTCHIRQDRTSARRESRRGLPAGPSDESHLSRRPPHQISSSFKFFEVSTVSYLPPRAKTRLKGALYVESVHREVSATSATGQRLPPSSGPATETAPADPLPRQFS